MSDFFFSFSLKSALKAKHVRLLLQKLEDFMARLRETSVYPIN